MTLPRQVRIALPAWIEEVVGPRRTLAGTEEKMALTVRLAAANVEREPGGGPFGAAVFRSDTGELISVGINSVIRLHNAALHAEVVALMLAHEALGVHSFRLPGIPPLELITSCDPCVMCLGTTAWSGVSRLVAGATKQDAEELGFDEGPVTADSYAQLQRHGVEVIRGVLRPEAKLVLRRYQELGRPIY
jgi:tRNA(Arg) A34 adenosine deaminase TadA